MPEVLAIPGWKTGPTTLESWVARLGEASGAPVEVERESVQGSWIILNRLRIRGYAMLAGENVEAINFEINDAEAATPLLESVAASLGWEIHPDDGDDADDDDD